jgi:hypothetical protein
MDEANLAPIEGGLGDELESWKELVGSGAVHNDIRYADNDIGQNDDLEDADNDVGQNDDLNLNKLHGKLESEIDLKHNDIQIGPGTPNAVPMNVTQIDSETPRVITKVFGQEPADSSLNFEFKESALEQLTESEQNLFDIPKTESLQDIEVDEIADVLTSVEPIQKPKSMGSSSCKSLNAGDSIAFKPKVLSFNIVY